MILPILQTTCSQSNAPGAHSANGELDASAQFKTRHLIVLIVVRICNPPPCIVALFLHSISRKYLRLLVSVPGQTFASRPLVDDLALFCSRSAVVLAAHLFNVHLL